MIPPNDQSLYNPTSPIENVLPSDNMANQNEDYYKQKFLQHAALSEHYARQKQANAGDSMLYYQFAELEYYHKSRALHYKAFFAAEEITDESY
ncbi:MAG: hypothetical protein K0S41_3664 [Anaerocolumna sp.]|jgi:hypothetical protein|nr:hypothetical protein [Anaerocolumna sp.]